MAPRLAAPAAERIHGVITKAYGKAESQFVIMMASALARVAGNCDVRTVINILKFPLCVGPLRVARRNRWRGGWGGRSGVTSGAWSSRPKRRTQPR